MAEEEFEEGEEEFGEIVRDAYKIGVLKPLQLINLIISGTALNLIGSVVPPIKREGNAMLNKAVPNVRLDPEQIVVTKFRTDMSDDDYYKQMRENGLNEKRADNIWTISQYAPRPDDVITWGVREAFNEDVVKQFGLDQDIPAMFKPFNELSSEEEASLPEFWRMIGKTYVDYLGLRGEEAKYFWRSHWILPSVSQAYEFVQRLNPEVLKVLGDKYKGMGLDPDKLGFTLEELKQLLKVQDIMPVWRDRLAATSYTPILRVDLRRMYEAKLVNDEEFIARNMELGYTKADAELTLTWLKWELDETRKTKTSSERDLTKSEILKAYRMKQIDDNECKESLKVLGYDENEADFLIDLYKGEEKSARREMSAGMVTNLYRYGMIDLDEARTKLMMLEYDAEAADWMLELIDYKRANDARPLTYEMTKGMFYAGFIDEDMYYNRLVGLGFIPDDAALLVEFDKYRAPKPKK